MTERIRTLTVLLDRDYREDDIEHFITVIGAIRGVDDVIKGEPVDASAWMARNIARRELYRKIIDLLVTEQSELIDKEPRNEAD